MKFGILNFQFAIHAILLCLLLQVPANADYRLKVGEHHADFELPRIDNREPVKLSDFHGKKILLLHFASW